MVHIRVANVLRLHGTAAPKRLTPAPTRSCLEHCIIPVSNRRLHSFQFTPVQKQLQTSYTSQTRTRPNAQSRTLRSKFTSRSQIRACSYQRHNMCRHSSEADVGGSAVDITQGREILPANVKATHYRLTLEPDLKTFEYKGTVEIE